jgi:hypothetical protein
MPPVDPRHEFVLVLAVPLLDQSGTATTLPFLNFADHLVVPAFALLQAIIGELAPLVFQVTFELHPCPFELIRRHGLPLLCEVALPHCLY